MKRRKKKRIKGQVDYHRYIRSTAWAAKRKMMLDLYDYCVLCGSQGQLYVHHLHFRTLGNEQPEDLAVVCSACHDDLYESSHVER